MSVFFVSSELIVADADNWKPIDIVNKNPIDDKTIDGNFTVKWYELERNPFKYSYIITVKNLQDSSKNIDIKTFIRNTEDIFKVNNEHLYEWKNITLYGNINRPYNCNYLDNSSKTIIKICNNVTYEVTGSELGWEEINRQTKEFISSEKQEGFGNINFPKLSSVKKDGTNIGTKIFKYEFQVPFNTRGIVGFLINGKEYHPPFGTNTTTAENVPLIITNNDNSEKRLPRIEINLSELNITCTFNDCADLQLVYNNATLINDWNWKNQTNPGIDSLIEWRNEYNLTANEVNLSFSIFSNSTEQFYTNRSFILDREEFEDGCSQWYGSSNTCAADISTSNCFNGTSCLAYSSNSIAYANINDTESKQSITQRVWVAQWFYTATISALQKTQLVHIGEEAKAWDTGDVLCVARIPSGDVQFINATTGGGQEWESTGYTIAKDADWTFIKCEAQYNAGTDDRISAGYNYSINNPYNSENSGGRPTNGINIMAIRAGLTGNTGQQQIDNVYISVLDFNDYEDLAPVKAGVKQFQPSPNIAPTFTKLELNSTTGLNQTGDNLTIGFVGSTDSDGDTVIEIIDWRENNISDAVLNMPMETQSNLTSAKDYSMNGNDGNIIDATCNTTGLIGSACHFDGINDYIDTGNDTSTQFGTNDFTVSYWIKTTAKETSGVISRRRVAAADEAGWAIGSKANDDCQIHIGDGLGNFVDDGAIDCLGLYDGNFHHVVVVFDRSDVISYYQDGVLKDTTISIASVGDVGASVDLTLGAYRGGATLFFDGSIDQVMIWNRTLSSDEIAERYFNNTKLHSDATTKGELWSVNGTVNDGTEDGTNLQTEQMEILNTPPLFEPITNFALLEDFLDVFTNLTLNATDPDEISGILNYSYVITASTIANINTSEIDDLLNTTGNLTYSSLGNQTGSFDINITALDPEGEQNSTNFTLTITAVNDAPLFDNIANFIITEDAQLAELNISLNISDIDDPLTDLNYTIFENNSLFTTLAVENSTGNFTFQPTGNSTGTTTINITVIDSDGTGEIESDVFDIAVSEVNDAPSEPRLHLPLNDTNFSTIPTFSWSNSSDVEGNETNYTIEISTDVTFGAGTNYTNSSILETANVTNDTGVSLSVDAQYYWRVIAFDDANSSFSEIRTFLLLSATTSPPIRIIEPQNKTYFGVTLDLTFVTDATNETIFFNLDDGINTTITADTTFTTVDGDHILKLFVNDSNNNFNETNVTFNIDQTAGEQGTPSGGGGGGSPSTGITCPLGTILENDKCINTITDAEETPLSDELTVGELTGAVPALTQPLSLFGLDSSTLAGASTIINTRFIFGSLISSLILLNTYNVRKRKFNKNALWAVPILIITFSEFIVDKLNIGGQLEQLLNRVSVIPGMTDPMTFIVVIGAGLLVGGILTYNKFFTKSKKQQITF